MTILYTPDDTLDCPLCGENNDLDDYELIVSVSVKDGRVQESALGCPSCSGEFPHEVTGDNDRWVLTTLPRTPQE